jgi:glucose-6-phosphate 1-dehydrogenase
MARRALVIFGATGDLALRMLFPSLYFLEADGLLPEDLAIIGSARGALSDEAFAAKVAQAVGERSGGSPNRDAWEKTTRRLRYVAADAAHPKSFETLAAELAAFDEILFYLSTSPDHYAPICRALSERGLTGAPNRVIVEKPIGRDLQSCRAINDALGSAFTEDRIFRIDHYLGKEAVQNLIALRFANTLFEPLWDKVSVEHVQITVAEAIGVEGRWSYYDQYGALRDMVQNHLLQLLALVAMEPPAEFDADAVRDEKVKVLRSLRPITPADAGQRTVRGQYAAGLAHGAPAYTDETGGGRSSTETFAALCAYVDNWRWAGVPFYLRTGKRMPERVSRIAIQFRPVPHSIFGSRQLVANRLLIELQPQEEISLLLMNKTPSLEHGGMQLKPLALNLSLTDAFSDNRRRRIAYERLLLEALKNDQTLFVRRDESEAAWSWIDGVQEAWRQQGQAPGSYVAGSWGPSAAQALTERNGHRWYD